ncbi:MAG: 4Fe-4S binding protein [Lentisphaeria bacterium]|nr:4Fe-4S binding protein [Lentisphaeria bacterium]
MLKFRLLKLLRILVSLLVLACFFAGFSSLYEFAGNAAKGEFLPSLLRLLTRFSLVSAAFFLVIAAVALLAGRLYCSFCCPLGVLQDIAARIGKLLSFNKFKYKPMPDFRRVRYVALLILVCFAVGGWIVPLGLFEPYTLFGRNAAGPGQSLFTEVNNQLYGNIEALQPLEPRPEFPLTLTVPAGLILLAVLLLAAYRGRVFCNTLCPAGALLGLLSKRAFVPLQLDPEKCMKCGQCVKVCKAGCIDVRGRKLDSERCVGCMNCGTVCKFGAIRFGRRAEKKAVETREEPLPDSGRRTFLAAAGASGALALIGGRLAGTAGKRNLAFDEAAGSVPPVMPPGAGSRDEFNRRCTGCGICIANCTGHTLKPAFLEYGLAGMGQPRLSFEIGKCEYECRNCSELCPTGALRKLTQDEKRHCRIGEVQYCRERCVVVTDGTSCGACAEHCPTGALQMVPYKDHLTIPHVIRELCIGCGCCQYICPVMDEKGKAIMVHGVAEQTRAADPRKVLEKSQPVQAETEEFPF